MPGYKAKTIKAVITKKINKWIESVDDTTVKELLKSGVIVTGGCIVSMLQGEEVNDFDVYLRDKTTALAVANYYVSKFKATHPANMDFELYVEDTPDYLGVERVKIVAKSVGIASDDGKSSTGEYKYFEAFPDEQGSAYISRVMDNPEEIEDVHEDTSIEAKRVEPKGDFRPVFLSGNAITLSDKIQIVLRFYGTPEEIHENYDFVHCTSYWSNFNDKLVLNPAALECILSKELRYIGSKYPICSLVRLRKFITRGWRINAGQILKMAMQVSALDLTSVEVLADQLTGVDTAYFVQLIERLKEKDPERIDTAYLVEIVDRMF